MARTMRKSRMSDQAFIDFVMLWRVDLTTLAIAKMAQKWLKLQPTRNRKLNRCEFRKKSLMLKRKLALIMYYGHTRRTLPHQRPSIPFRRTRHRKDPRKL